MSFISIIPGFGEKNSDSFPTPEMAYQVMAHRLSVTNSLAKMTEYVIATADPTIPMGNFKPEHNANTSGAVLVNPSDPRASQIAKGAIEVTYQEQFGSEAERLARKNVWQAHLNPRDS